MFFNHSSTTPTSFSNNSNNNPNQLNPNNQTSLFSFPTNQPNNSFGSLPPQPSGGLLSNQIQQQSQVGGVFSNQVQQSSTGGFFGSPQPSAGLFGNQIQQQQSQGGSFLSNQIQQQTGGLLSNQVQQQPPIGNFFGGEAQQQAQGGGLFGNPYQQSGGVLGHPPVSGMGGGFDPSRLHTFVPRTSIPLNGTVDYIGRNDVNRLQKNRDGHRICSMTARIIGHTLDEQRMADYSNLKNNTLNIDEKRRIFSAIHGNLRRINPPGAHPQFLTVIPPILDCIFSDPTINLPANTMIPQRSTLLGSQASGSLFMNPQPLQIIPSPLMTNNSSSDPLSNQPSVIQNSSLPTQTPTVSQAETKKTLIKYVKPRPAKSEKKALGLNSGSFNYEFNKMLFVSGLVQIMEKHNMTVPENLLDDTDFAPQLLAFLEQHNISLPAENIPQFQIDSGCLQTQSADECE